jgi:hypothetical protein
MGAVAVAVTVAAVAVLRKAVEDIDAEMMSHRVCLYKVLDKMRRLYFTFLQALSI